MLGTLDIEAAAKKAAGNWQAFDSFVWVRDRELEDADKWAIIYTSNRDSGLLDRSNAAVIEKALGAHTEDDDPDVVAEQHSHFLVGHVYGYSIRVFDGGGNITEAFRTYFGLLEQMEAYPVLYESDYSQREYDATLSNIEDAAWRVKREFVLPEGWESQVYSWLSDNEWSGTRPRRSSPMATTNETALREAAEAALRAFRRMYEMLEAGADADDLLDDETLWPLTRLRAALEATQ